MSMGVGEWVVCLLAQSHGNSSGACVLRNGRSTVSFAMTGAAIPHDATCIDVECELPSIACGQVRIIDSMFILPIDSLVTQHPFFKPSSSYCLLTPSYKTIVRSPVGSAALLSHVGHRPGDFSSGTPRVITAIGRAMTPAVRCA